MDEASKKVWSDRIQQQELSEKSVSQWCREQSISFSTFLYWRSRLQQKKDKIVFPSFTEVTDSSTSSLYVGDCWRRNGRAS